MTGGVFDVFCPTPNHQMNPHEGGNWDLELLAGVLTDLKTKKLVLICSASDYGDVSNGVMDEGKVEMVATGPNSPHRRSQRWFEDTIRTHFGEAHNVS